MKILLFILVFFVSISSYADEDVPSGRWRCIADELDNVEISEIYYEGKNFNNNTHVVILKHDTGNIIEFNSLSSGTWYISHGKINYRIKTIHLEPINEEGSRFISMYKDDPDIKNDFSLTINNINDDMLSFFNDKGGLVYCLKS